MWTERREGNRRADDCGAEQVNATRGQMQSSRIDELREFGQGRWAWSVDGATPTGATTWANVCSVDRMLQTTFVHEGTSVQRRGLQCRQIEVVVYNTITQSTGQSLLGEVDDCEESTSERNEVCALRDVGSCAQTRNAHINSTTSTKARSPGQQSRRTERRGRTARVSAVDGQIEIPQRNGVEEVRTQTGRLQ